MRYEIVVDSGETANKCTIAPLSYRKDFSLIPVFGEGPLGPLTAPLLLHHEGECLTKLKPFLVEVSALACIDSVWRRLPKILPRLAWEKEKAVLVKIPDGFQTAYPRVGLPHQDPSGGLATIEALFIAASLLGNWDVSLLSHYFFSQKFVALNTARFLELGVSQAAIPELLPGSPLHVRNALSRRRNRGRAPEGKSTA